MNMYYIVLRLKNRFYVDFFLSMFVLTLYIVYLSIYVLWIIFLMTNILELSLY